MRLIRTKAFARAGLLGNPSDGYFGRTISAVVRNFCARVTLYEWDQLELVPSQQDHSRFRSVDELAHDVQLHGYYGGLRLVKATIKKFVEFCRRQGLKLHDQNFSVRYQSDIPRQVGLAGSSAIIVATLRALIEFYELEIPREVQPSLALSVETEELGIAAGLQDRVIQIYEGLVAMDFSPGRMHDCLGLACGVYEPLDPALLPPWYLAYDADAGEPTEVVHNDLRSRYQRGEPAVREAMTHFAALAQQGREALLQGDAATLGRLMDQNFDLRRSICRIADRHLRMIDTARSCGLPAKFAGSGGAIVGLCPSPEDFARLEAALGRIGCRVIRPQIQEVRP